MEVIFEAEDHDLSSGSMGFMTNKARATYFDMFLLDPLDCWQDEDIGEEDFIYAEHCNRYKESYEGDLFTRWQDVSAPDMVDIEENKI